MEIMQNSLLESEESVSFHEENFLREFQVFVRQLDLGDGVFQRLSVFFQNLVHEPISLLHVRIVVHRQSLIPRHEESVDA